MASFAGQLADALEYGWESIARPNQLPPPGDWSIWLLLAGRGFGKTRVLSEMCNFWATTGQARRIAIVGSTAGDCRDVIVEGESGILATAPDWCRPIYQATRRQLQWPNGASRHCTVPRSQIACVARSAMLQFATSSGRGAIRRPGTC